MPRGERLSTAPRAPDVTPGSFLDLLSEEEFAAVHQLGTRRAFGRGSVLMFEKERSEHVTLILAGRVKATRLGDDGREVMLSIRDPGDVVGEIGFVDGEPRLATVTALERVDALVIPAQTFRAHLERTPRVAVVLLEVLTRRFREATVNRAQFVSLDTMGRLSARIVEVAERYGVNSDGELRIAMPISQEELAGWVGSSRAGMAHALQTMRELRWIATERRRLVVRDLDALRARAA
jgi:CRP/FNR family transcriptional regulator, cyclic AMP receptor protein